MKTLRQFQPKYPLVNHRAGRVGMPMIWQLMMLALTLLLLNSCSAAERSAAVETTLQAATTLVNSPQAVVANQGEEPTTNDATTVETTSAKDADETNPATKANESANAMACPAPAFPTAEGFGAAALGGRGGKVIEVTNLNSDGEGSLRAAIQSKGPRIVVFRVGGTIELTERLQIKEPFLTIAGQSAPGGGITLKSKGVDRDLLKISTHDIVIRYLRVRPGPGGDSGGITIDGGKTRDVILDHMSISWSVDENLTTWYDNANITIQWSIIAEGLNNSTHSEGPHSKGLMLGADGSRNLSVHHNLLAHNVERSPRIKTSGLVDFTNNVIYDYGVAAGWITNDYGDLQVNYVGNYIKPGPDSDRERHALEIDLEDKDATISVYVQGNLSQHRLGEGTAQNAVVKEDAHKFLTNTIHPAPHVTTTSAEKAYEQVLANAGTTLPMRDAVDERIVQEVLNGTGRIVDDPSQVGGWPVLAPGTPPADDDHDGMSNSWETANGFDPQNAVDNSADPDEDGYTNVEEYLNSTAPRVNDVHNSDLCLFMPIINR